MLISRCHIPHSWSLYSKPAEIYLRLMLFKASVGVKNIVRRRRLVHGLVATHSIFLLSCVHYNTNVREFNHSNRATQRDALSDNCGKCDFKNICGGYRARAIYTGDINGCDPGCIRNRVAYEKMVNTAPVNC